MRFLSDAWLAALDEAMATSPAVAAATAGTSLRVRQVVTGGPDGDVAYVVAVEDGRARVAPAAVGPAADGDAEVTLASDWPTAVAIATGALAAHDAFTTGRLVVRGDVDVLRREASALADLDAAFARLRASTTY